MISLYLYAADWELLWESHSIDVVVTENLFSKGLKKCFVAKNSFSVSKIIQCLKNRPIKNIHSVTPKSFSKNIHSVAQNRLVKNVSFVTKKSFSSLKFLRWLKLYTQTCKSFSIFHQ